MKWFDYSKLVRAFNKDRGREKIKITEWCEMNISSDKVECVMKYLAFIVGLSHLAEIITAIRWW